MGGLLAFEVVRELRRRGDRLPVRLYLRWQPATAAADDARPAIADLPDEEFLAPDRRAGRPAGGAAGGAGAAGADPAGAAGRLRLAQPVRRTEPAEPLPVPLVCLAGSRDPGRRPGDDGRLGRAHHGRLHAAHQSRVDICSSPTGPPRWPRWSAPTCSRRPPQPRPRPVLGPLTPLRPRSTPPPRRPTPPRLRRWRAGDI